METIQLVKFNDTEYGIRKTVKKLFREPEYWYWNFNLKCGWYNDDPIHYRTSLSVAKEIFDLISNHGEAV